MDSNRELRAMAMVAFPCPPLPVSSEEDDGRVLNSHDLLAMLMETAARREREEEDQERRRAQAALIEAFGKTEERTWDGMTDFCRRYLMLYNPILHRLRFLPPDVMPPRLKAQVCEWLAARHILKGQESRSEDFGHLGPVELYKRCALAGSP